MIAANNGFPLVRRKVISLSSRLVLLKGAPFFKKVIMEIKLYCTPPSDKEFNELKEKAIEIFQIYNNNPSYVHEKVTLIKDIKNIGDNFMYMVSIFDKNNQSLLSSRLSSQTRDAVRVRLISGGTLEQYIVF